MTRDLERNTFLNVLARSSLAYFAVALLIFQIAMDSLIPLSLVYDYRVNYNVLKDNVSDMDPVLDLISRTIKQKGITDYCILLGDSIAYSGPGGSDESISYYLNQISQKHGGSMVFNLAFPAAQLGDVYTMLYKLHEKGIATDNVIINITYGSFAKRDPNPPIVYWLTKELERLDVDTYEDILPILKASTENPDTRRNFDVFLDRWVYQHIPILKYRNFIRNWIFSTVGVPPEVEGDKRPWYQKPYLKELLERPEYGREFSDEPFEMSAKNPNVYFIHKILEQDSKRRMFFFLSPVNSELMAEKTSKPGFHENLTRIDELFASVAEKVHYCDLINAIDSDEFCDHLHLTPRGYETLAEILWEWINEGNAGGLEAEPSGVS